MKAILIASLAMVLIGCKISDDDDSTNDDELSQWEKLQANLCDLTPIIPFSEVKISGQGDSLRLRPTSSRAEVLVTGNGSSACIDGDLYLLDVRANVVDVVIDGQAAFISINADAAMVYVLGAASSIDISGDNNRVYAESVSSLTDNGIGNEILDIRGLNVGLVKY